MAAKKKTVAIKVDPPATPNEQAKLALNAKYGKAGEARPASVEVHGPTLPAPSATELALRKASQAVADAVKAAAEDGGPSSFSTIHKLSRIGHALDMITAKRVKDFRPAVGPGMVMAYPPNNAANINQLEGGDLDDGQGQGLGVDAPYGNWAPNAIGFGGGADDVARLTREALLIQNETLRGAGAERASKIAANEAGELTQLRDELRAIKRERGKDAARLAKVLRSRIARLVDRIEEREKNHVEPAPAQPAKSVVSADVPRRHPAREQG